MNPDRTPLAGLVAIVTGASRGIGKAIALALAGQGVRTVLVGRSETDLAAVRSEIQARDGAALAIAVDLARAEAAGEIVERTVRHFGRLDILVNNAGQVHSGPIERTPVEVFDRLMAVNVRAPFLLCARALGHLRKSERASIINIASVVAHSAYAGQGAYAASKHALLGMTKVLAREVHADGIRVHAISPGGVDTDMVAQVRPDLDQAVLMRPDDVAEVVVFLLLHRTNAVIDEIRLRRASSDPSF